ncbi:MAG: biotin--[acetyl-CoA-carboxylase] ligase [Candidatus Omnitrophica bacterium]|nr:biotin--[acetyl-CoA-carboxylase] ligase [Candidatus Omnitrophota bacterium]
MQEKIIQFLKQTDGYVSGEEMSQQLNMSRAAIWKHMQELRALGYDIAAVPHLGYQLVASPDRLFAHEIQFGLSTKTMGQKIFAFDSISSTMDEAFRLGMEGTVEGTVVCAEGQTKGRGRLGRGWLSPKTKGIYCSLVLRPKLPPTQMPRLTLMTAVALAEAVHQTTSLQPMIKWPNDLVIGSKKLAGILTELRAEVDQVKFVVVGIGLNVNAASWQLPEAATSLKIETRQTINRIRVFQETLKSMEFWYNKVLKGHFDEVLDYCKQHSATLKKRVRVHDSAGDSQGEALDIDSDGGLLIRQDNGTLIKKMAGDVRQI